MIKTPPRERYMVFRGDSYYPSGGWGDFVGFFGLEQAKKEAFGDWSQIIDTETMKEIFP